MKHIQKFSKAASTYEERSFLQKNILEELFKNIDISKFNSLLDLGSGPGLVFKKINNKNIKFVAIDASENMCSLHPVNENTTVICDSFDNQELLKSFQNTGIDLITAGSSLHWSDNLEQLFLNISNFKAPLLAAIFLKGSFYEIRNITKKESELPSKEEIIHYISKYNIKAFCYEKEYILNFESKKELFNYLKETGVGGRNNLSMKESIHLIRNLNTLTLTAKVLFLKPLV